MNTPDSWFAFPITKTNPLLPELGVNLFLPSAAYLRDLGSKLMGIASNDDASIKKMLQP